MTEQANDGVPICPRKFSVGERPGVFFVPDKPASGGRKLVCKIIAAPKNNRRDAEGSEDAIGRDRRLGKVISNDRRIDAGLNNRISRGAVDTAPECGA